MKLAAFLHDLHFATEKVRPPDLEVNWDDAPLPYKLYKGLPAVTLPGEVALSLTGEQITGEPSLVQLGSMLYYAYGLTKVSQMAFGQGALEEESFFVQSYRRAIPSGGALYPNEVYLYLKLSYLTQGVYHYDVAHHRLVLLREGDFADYVTSSLGQRLALRDCFGVVFVSTYFWKNAFKYDLFSYRLQGLDTGVLLGQWLALANKYGIQASVHYLFLDRAVNGLLGLDGDEESVYAILPLALALNPQQTGETTADSALTLTESSADAKAPVSAEQLVQSLQPLSHRHQIGSNARKDYPLLRQMHLATLYESTDCFVRETVSERPFGAEKDGGKLRGRPGETEAAKDRLPALDFAEFCRSRSSPELDFVAGKLTREELETIVWRAYAALHYQHDLGHENNGCLAYYVCLHQVDEMEDGAYFCAPASGLLTQRRPGDQRAELQAGMTLDNVSLYQVPLCFHIAGESSHLLERWGYRGYRIQQMQAGIALHALLLAAFSCGLGGHPLLGYDVASSDEIYGLPQESKTCLIQVPVGFYRQRARLQGSLHG